MVEDQLRRPNLDPELFRHSAEAQYLFIPLVYIARELANQEGDVEARHFLELLKLFREDRQAPLGNQLRGRNGDRQLQLGTLLQGKLNVPLTIATGLS